MIKHEHAELIHAWADGAKIQYWYHGEWVDWESYTSPSWGKNIKYRIKPNESACPRFSCRCGIVHTCEPVDIDKIRYENAKEMADWVETEALKTLRDTNNPRRKRDYYAHEQSYCNYALRKYALDPSEENLKNIIEIRQEFKHLYGHLY